MRGEVCNRSDDESYDDCGVQAIACSRRSDEEVAGGILCVHESRRGARNMIDDTINGNKTVAGGGKDVVLAWRYHIIR